MLNFLISRNAKESIKSAKHTHLAPVPDDCQIEASEQHTRTDTVQVSGVSMPMINSCASANISRHHQLLSDQEPPDGDETDPDVIPNQYGK